ncbi:MAG: hypothetical protein ACC707_12780 [Thiohalomonadales bacterium]
MKVKSKTIVKTETVIEVGREDLINALNASGGYNIPYNARVWIDCEKREKFNIDNEGLVNIQFYSTEDIPEESDEPIHF